MCGLRVCGERARVPRFKSVKVIIKEHCSTPLRILSTLFSEGVRATSFLKLNVRCQGGLQILRKGSPVFPP